jgi:hypothetical protein
MRKNWCATTAEVCRKGSGVGMVGRVGCWSFALLFCLGVVPFVSAQDRSGDGFNRERPRRFGGGRHWLKDKEGPKFEDVMAFLGEHFPDRVEEMRRLKAESPRAFRRRMMQMMPKVHRMMFMFERNPDVAKLMIREEQLSGEIRAEVENFRQVESASSRDAVLKDIRKLVTERLELQHDMKRLEIERLEDRLESVKERLSRDENRRDVLIERTLDDLGVLRDTDD